MMNEYYIHDARKLSEALNTKVDLIITSPPYFDMKDYGPDNQIGFGQKYEDYMKDMGQVLKQCLDVSKKSASMWMIVDTLKKDGQFKLLPFDLVAEAEKVGWRLQDIIIWKKDKTLPFSRRGELRNIFEYVLFFVKTENYKYYPERITELDIKEWWIKYPERYSPSGKAKSDVWEFAIPVQGSWGNHYVRHFCPLPARMIDQIIQLCTDEGDVVLDPFAGSGAVLTEAHKLNRNFIGCDLNKEFRAMFYEYLSKVDRGIQLDDLTEEDVKAIFGDTITKLRILKWPSALLKKLRQSNSEAIQYINGVIISSTEETKDIKYSFYLKKRNKQLEKLIQDLSTKSPFTKYGFKTSLEFITEMPSTVPVWEYNWISTHLAPKKFEGKSSPFIASDVVLEDRQRSLVDNYTKTGKVSLT